MQYELFYLIGERQEANLAEIKEEIGKMLVSEKATLLDPEVTEKRKLAYEIKHQKKGTYITRRFELPEDLASEAESGIQSITRKLNLNSNVLRSIIVKTSELPELGAKERRQQMEQQNPKDAKRPEAKPAKAERKAEEQPVAKKIVKEEKPAETVEASKEEVKKEEVKAEKAPKKAAPKKEEKDIDKQLDELLNI